MTGNGAVEGKRDVNQPLCTSRRHMWEWRYNCTYSRSGIRVSSQIHASAALPAGKWSSVLTESATGLAPRTGLDAFEHK